MDKNVILRPMESADLDQVEKLEQTCFTRYQAHVWSAAATVRRNLP